MKRRDYYHGVSNAAEAALLQNKKMVEEAKVSVFTFFGVKIPAAYFEENIHRKVAKVEDGSQKRNFVPEIIRHGG
jgi:hypothetical protein